MSHYFNRYILFAMLLLASCSKDNSLEKMEQIKMIGNKDPNKALVMLDSLDTEIKGESDYAIHKYELLRVRLNDKADNIPSSDSLIKKQIEYFDKNGSAVEKQEAYYYAGSVYRDLQDTPRALEHFFKSLDYALGNKKCDSILLENTYSNLSYLYFQVQDYNNALEAAQKEFKVNKDNNHDKIIAFMHLGATYLAVDSSRQAKAAFDSAYSHAIDSKDITNLQDVLIHLLNKYSEMKDMERAKRCKALIYINPLKDFSSISCMAFAQYYESIGKQDSAVIYCKRVLEEKSYINSMYDAAKMLFRIYSRAGETYLTNYYAGIYMQLSDSMDFGKRQELAATVNNEYKYHLDQRKEQELKDEKEKYKNRFTIVSLSALLLACIGYAFYYRRKNKHLQQVLELSSQLTEKIDQNKRIITMLHQSELEGKAEDVIKAIKQSSKGKMEITSVEWKQLYQAVDELYPSFKDRLLKELGTFTEHQMQVCYLMRIGLSTSQIYNMVDLSRTTIWRWVKKYKWLTNSDYNA